MKTTGIECDIVVAPDLREDATSPSQDDVVSLVHTDARLKGRGVADTGPWLVKAAATHLVAAIPHCLFTEYARKICPTRPCAES